MESISTHNTPQALYDALVGRFGETIARAEHRETRWVEIGCGSTLLTFFAPSDGSRDVRVTLPAATTYERREAG